MGSSRRDTIRPDDVVVGGFQRSRHMYNKNGNYSPLSYVAKGYVSLELECAGRSQKTQYWRNVNTWTDSEHFVLKPNRKLPIERVCDSPFHRNHQTTSFWVRKDPSGRPRVSLKV